MTPSGGIWLTTKPNLLILIVILYLTANITNDVHFSAYCPSSEMWAKHVIILSLRLPKSCTINCLKKVIQSKAHWAQVSRGGGAVDGGGGKAAGPRRRRTSPPRRRGVRLSAKSLDYGVGPLFTAGRQLLQSNHFPFPYFCWHSTK